MKTFKKVMLSVTMLFVSFASFGVGVPVFDGAQNTQMLAEWVEKVKQWGETAQHYKNQIQAYQDQLAAATGIREIGAFTNEIKNLQSELTNIYKQGDSFVGNFSKNPTGMLSQEAESLFNKYGAFNMCSSGVQSKDNLCKAKVITNAANIEQGTEINKQLAQSMKQIQSLSSRIENAKDIKESQDLANGLQAQLLKVQAIKMQYDVWDNKNKADAEMFNAQEKAALREQQMNAPVPTFN
ncbi:type IV secretion system protein [Xenorhabdus entomophaga]|uniref:type IV secretion system protein n=1 Tax=Xenorhabdus entomophaga TaxID=3136257 RepID=UPI0030F3D0CF